MTSVNLDYVEFYQSPIVSNRFGHEPPTVSNLGSLKAKDRSADPMALPPKKPSERLKEYNLIEILNITTPPLPLMERGDTESKYDGTEAYCQTCGNYSKRPRNVCDLSPASDVVWLLLVLFRLSIQLYFF